MDRQPPLSWTRAPASALCLLLLSATAPAREVVHLHTVQKATSDPAVIERARHFAALADQHAVGELVAELQSLAQGAKESGIAREWLLDRGLHELSRLKPTPDARALIEQLSHQPPQIFVRVDPDHGSHALPLYDPAATARFAARQWERADAREKSAAALSSGLTWPIERFARDDASSEIDTTKAGIADAFRTVAPQALIRQRGALIAALERGERVDEIAAVTAERLRDGELYSLVMNHADAIVALDALKRARTLLGDAAALDTLILASRRQDISSAALLEIGLIARQDATAREYLFKMLDDPSGASSAAAALASLHDPTVAAEIGRRLRASTKESARRELALALKLDDSSAARAQLDQFVKSSAGSAELRKEVRKWLAR